MRPGRTRSGSGISNGSGPTSSQQPGKSGESSRHSTPPKDGCPAGQEIPSLRLHLHGDGIMKRTRFRWHHPIPEFAAMMAEECQRLLDALDDDALRQVALSRMEGYTNDEIAAQLGCARRTIARRLELIRKTWESAVEVT